MLTIALIAIPALLGAAILVLGAKSARMMAMIASGIQVIITALSWYFLSQGNTAQLMFSNPWIADLGLSASFNLDGISLVLVLLSALSTPLIIYSTYNRTFRNPHYFYALMLFMIAAMNGAFTAADGLIFYVFYEVALIPIYFLILLWGAGEDRVKVTLKFFLYTLFGSLFMLVSLLYVYQHTTPRSFSFEALYAAGQMLSTVEQGLVFAGIFIAFAVKMPVFPFHTWQAPTYNAAPTAGTMLLAALMLKMATYGLIRMVLPMVPEGVSEYGHWAILLSVIGIVYGSLMAIAQRHYKLLIAYSSLAHVGLISAGILAAGALGGTAEGITGGLFEMLSHGILAIGLFFVCDILEARQSDGEMSALGGIREVNPLFAFLFFAIVMGSVALPFTSGFVGEYLLIQGLAGYSIIYALFGGLTVILGAVYMLRAFQVMMLGPARSGFSFAGLDRREKIILITIVILIVVLGVYPAPVLEFANSSVQTLFGNIR